MIFKFDYSKSLRYNRNMRKHNKNKEAISMVKRLMKKIGETFGKCFDSLMFSNKKTIKAVRAVLIAESVLFLLVFSWGNYKYGAQLGKQIFKDSKTVEQQVSDFSFEEACKQAVTESQQRHSSTLEGVIVGVQAIIFLGGIAVLGTAKERKNTLMN